MYKSSIFFLIICMFSVIASIRWSITTVKHKYPVLFRDHVFKNLTEKGKEMFFAVGIHPSCQAKKGQCIKRSQCVGPDMLYLSRICYKRDLVCCYDSSIRFPEVADK